MDADNSPIVFDAIADHTATVIIIHGLGDSAAAWSIPVEGWRRNGTMDEVKFVLPNAPEIPITANMGMEMQAWFDIVCPLLPSYTRSLDTYSFAESL